MSSTALHDSPGSTETSRTATVAELDVPNMIRRVRRAQDLSQAELAMQLGVCQSTVARWETGAIDPGVGALQKVLAMAGWELKVRDPSTDEDVPPMRPDGIRDRAGRRAPAHLDVVPFWPFPDDRTQCEGLYRSVPLRPGRDWARQRLGRIRDDHLTEKRVRTMVALARAESRMRRRALYNRITDAAVARGEPDPRAPEPCTCPVDCEEGPGCIPECGCRCEADDWQRTPPPDGVDLLQTQESDDRSRTQESGDGLEDKSPIGTRGVKRTESVATPHRPRWRPRSPS